MKRGVLAVKPLATVKIFTRVESPYPKFVKLKPNHSMFKAGDYLLFLQAIFFVLLPL